MNGVNGGRTFGYVFNVSFVAETSVAVSVVGVSWVWLRRHPAMDWRRCYEPSVRVHWSIGANILGKLPRRGAALCFDHDFLTKIAGHFSSSRQGVTASFSILDCRSLYEFQSRSRPEMEQRRQRRASNAGWCGGSGVSWGQSSRGGGGSGRYQWCSL